MSCCHLESILPVSFFGSSVHGLFCGAGCIFVAPPSWVDERVQTPRPIRVEILNRSSSLLNNSDLAAHSVDSPCGFYLSLFNLVSCWSDSICLRQQHRSSFWLILHEPVRPSLLSCLSRRLGPEWFICCPLSWSRSSSARKLLRLRVVAG